MSKKYKWLSYRRAAFPTINGEDNSYSLESYLLLALSRLPIIEQRRMDIQGRRLEALSHEHTNEGVFIHYSLCTPGEEMSVVTSDNGLQQVDSQTLVAPDGMEYQDGDGMALIKGNDVVLCPNNLHENTHRLFFCQLFQKAGLAQRSYAVELRKVGKWSALRRIQEYGVKSFDVDASMFAATLMGNNPNSQGRLRTRFLGNVAEIFQAYFRQGNDFEQVDRQQSLQVSIKLNTKGRFVPEVVKSQMAVMSELIFDQEESGYTIELRNGEKITPQEVTVRKRIRLQPYGKSVFKQDAWSALMTFMSELRTDGTLDQN